MEITFPKDKPVILFGLNNAGKTNILSGIQSFWDMYGRQSKIPEMPQGSPKTQEEGGSEIADAAKISNGLTADTKITLYYEDPECHEDRIIELAYDPENKRFLNIKPRPDEPISIGSTFSGTDYGKVFSELRDILKFGNLMPGGKRLLGRISSALGKIKHFEKIDVGGSEELLVPGKGELAFLGLVVDIFKASELENENNANDTLLLLYEPETHLHFLAQEGLMEIINSICKEEGVQVVIATHAENFLDADDLEGFVRVYKENGITKALQLTDYELSSTCDKKLPIGDYWSVKLNTDQLKGFFADVILLVEWQTEQYALPIYLRSFLSENGVQIVPCYSKSAIPTYWRLFTAYGYKCFIVFDHDDDLPPQLERRTKKAKTQKEKKAIQGEIKKEIEKNQNLEKLCKFKASPSCLLHDVLIGGLLQR